MKQQERSIWPTLFGCIFLIGVVLLIFTLGTSEMPEDEINPPQDVLDQLQKIEHVIVIYQENRSFDHLFGHFPGAEGIPENVSPQRQFKGTAKGPFEDGPVYDRLPGPYTPEFYIFGDNIPDKRFPKTLKNEPFSMEPYVKAYSPNLYESVTGDPVHRFYQCIGQINGGKMDKFVAWASLDWQAEKKVYSLVMANVDSQKSPLAKLASDYVLCDHFFQSMYGGSAPNHWVLFAGQPLRWKEGLDDPQMKKTQGAIVKLNAEGFPTESQDDGWLSPEGWVVNNPQDSGPDWSWQHFTPPPETQTNPTIGDRLIEKNISWKWYAEYLEAIPGANGKKAIDQRTEETVTNYAHRFRDGAIEEGDFVAAAAYEETVLAPSFLDDFIHDFINGFYIVTPFYYYKNFQLGSENAQKHIVDLNEFDRDLQNGTLPQVVFIKHFFPNDEHPSDSGLYAGQNAVVDLVEKVKNSEYWNKSVIIITYDENGGFWDHVAPPNASGFENSVDGFKFGPGPRVPCVVVSPHAKKGYIDPSLYQTTSITRFIEMRFNLEPVNEVTENSPPLMGWFQEAS